MNGECCTRRAGASGGDAPARRRWLDGAGWLASVATLAVIPKCPICFAAYVALGTGIGMSVTTARYLRWSMLAMCVVSLVFLSIRALGTVRGSGRLFSEQ